MSHVNLCVSERGYVLLQHKHLGQYASLLENSKLKKFSMCLDVLWTWNNKSRQTLNGSIPKLLMGESSGVFNSSISSCGLWIWEAHLYFCASAAVPLNSMFAEFTVGLRLGFGALPNLSFKSHSGLVLNAGMGICRDTWAVFIRANIGTGRNLHVSA